MTDAPVQGPVQATVSICNQRGLHARASAKFVKLASSFESEIRVTRDGVTVDAMQTGLISVTAYARDAFGNEYAIGFDPEKRTFTEI